MEDLSIIRWTLRLVKRPELKHAAQELQDEFNRLLNRIYEVAEQSSERASNNARQLLDELFGSLHAAAAYACAQRSSPSASGSLSLNGPTVLPRSNDTYCTSQWTLLHIKCHETIHSLCEPRQGILCLIQ